jgi:hypothetical protein
VVGPSAQIVCNPYPSGGLTGERDAHGGTFVTPPATGIPVDEIAAYRWNGSAFVEIPVQVDEMYPYCLSNPNSDFGVYSGTDMELSYAWDVESWKMTAGVCSKEYASGDGPVPDPVATLDDDDEIVFMASDAGSQAPVGATEPAGATDSQAIVITDPLDPATLRYVYLSGSRAARLRCVERLRRLRPRRERRRVHRPQQLPERRSRAARLEQHRLRSEPRRHRVRADAAARLDGGRSLPTRRRDRFHGLLPVARVGPLDGARSEGGRAGAADRARRRPDLRVAALRRRSHRPLEGPRVPAEPDSTISLVGFEDEQVNWEANSSLLGERMGAVRAIRETWGADSGTNVTKTESFYRDAITYRYHVRVIRFRRTVSTPPGTTTRAWRSSTTTPSTRCSTPTAPTSTA